jgi:hypothetical protein
MSDEELRKLVLELSRDIAKLWREITDIRAVIVDIRTELARGAQHGSEFRDLAKSKFN